MSCNSVLSNFDEEYTKNASDNAMLHVKDLFECCWDRKGMMQLRDQPHEKKKEGTLMMDKKENKVSVVVLCCAFLCFVYVNKS